MGRVFIFTVLCLGLTLVLSAAIIWGSFDKGKEALYESRFLGVKIAETRNNADSGGVPAMDSGNTPEQPLDYSKMTPGLQKLLREGKPNPEITVDKVR